MIGTMLGNRYELLEKIGEGGMAEVYKAKCHFLNRFVAVKILKNEYYIDTNFVEKFKREATAAASLSHNNIVTIYDVGSQENINYIVLEYVDGKTLKEIINTVGKLSSGAAVQFGIQIARALECAHKNNIIHRDIKPHNILVTDDGIVKVTDFGIAKASNSVTITNATKVMGSAHYFSPEQAKGNFVDARSDIYSLGIVFYEMVTGRVPYDAESPVSVALKHIQEPVVPPKQINELIDETLNKLILKAIEKEPIRRYQTVREMIIDLKKIEGNQVVNITSSNLDNEKTREMDAIVIDDEEDMDSKIGMSKKKKWLIILFGIIFTIASATVVATFTFSKAYNAQLGTKGASNTDVQVPKIIGKNKDEAMKLVESAGLKFTLTNKEQSDKPAGTVLNCYPEEGMNVKKGSEVRVSVSAGANESTLPDFKNMEINVAKDLITSLKLNLGGVTYEYNNNIVKDNVIRQTPDADTTFKSDTKVSLVVSKGPEYSYEEVPDLTNKTLSQASAILENIKLKLGNKTEESTSNKDLDGKIKSQNIAARVSVKEGTAVSVTYYKYKDTTPGDQGFNYKETKKNIVIR